MRKFLSYSTSPPPSSNLLMKWKKALTDHLEKALELAYRVKKIHIQPLNNIPFGGKVESGVLGDLQFYRILCTPHSFFLELNQATSIAHSAPPLLVLQISGVSHVEQKTGSGFYSAGDLFLLDYSNAFTVTTKKNCEYLVLLCGSRSKPKEKTSISRLSSRNGLVRILNNLATNTYSQYHALDDKDCVAIGEIITSLISTIVDNTNPPKNKYDHTTHRTSRAKAFIEENLENRNLSVKHVARAVACSIRTLHRTFSEHHIDGVTSYIWKRRLSKCAEALRNPEYSAKSITEISYDYGFTNNSHFGHLFKSEYGVSPRAYRESMSSIDRTLSETS